MFDFGKPESFDVVKLIVGKMEDKYLGIGTSDQLLKEMNVSRGKETLWTVIIIIFVALISALFVFR